MLLLDTNVVSDLRRPERANGDFRDWIKSASGLPLFVSVITILELQYGAEIKGHRDARQGAMLDEWIEREVVPRFSGRILPSPAEPPRCTFPIAGLNATPSSPPPLSSTA